MPNISVGVETGFISLAFPTMIIYHKLTIVVQPFNPSGGRYGIRGPVTQATVPGLQTWQAVHRPVYRRVILINYCTVRHDPARKGIGIQTNGVGEAFRKQKRRQFWRIDAMLNEVLRTSRPLQASLASTGAKNNKDMTTSHAETMAP